MDQGQTTPTALRPMDMKAFVQHLQQASPENNDPASDEAAQENQTRARSEIASIFELKDSRAFEWFEKEFVDKPYREAFDALRTKRDDVGTTQLIYIAIRAIKVGLIEREIAHRETLNPADEEIRRLQERLSQM